MTSFSQTPDYDELQSIDASGVSTTHHVPHSYLTTPQRSADGADAYLTVAGLQESINYAVIEKQESTLDNASSAQTVAPCNRITVFAPLARL